MAFLKKFCNPTHCLYPLTSYSTLSLILYFGGNTKKINNIDPLILSNSNFVDL